MNLTVSIPEITLNNSFIVYCFSYFITAVFISYFFKQANLFFKFFIFLMGIGFIQFLWNIESIEATLSALAGFIFVYREVISELVSSFTSSVENFIYSIKSFFSSIFSTIFGCFYFIFRSLRFVYYTAIDFFTAFYNLLSRIFNWGIEFNKAKEKRKDEKPKNSESRANNSRNESKKNNREDDKESTVNQAKEELKRAREQAKKREEEEKKEQQKQSSKTSQPNDNRSFQEILGLSNNFNKADLVKAYKIAVSRYHPDKYTHMSEQFQQEAQQEFVKIQRAYNYLLNSVND
jgi:hypothetical protein